MASVLVLVLSVIISVFLAPVTCQMDILNVKTIEDGTPFKITCNAQRVIATQGNFSTITVLQILVSSNAAHAVSSNGGQDYKMVAQYITLPLDGDTEASQDPPAGRKWQFSFNGSNSENRGANNKATMKIEILVPDTTCADAGLYKCVMSYSSNRVVFTDSNVQNVTSTVTSQMDILNVKTIEDGTPFKITCNAQRVIATQENFSTISILQILVLSNAAHVVSSNGAQDYKMVAQYMTLPLDGDTEASQDPPAGRKWQFSFNGSNSENRGANNKATMKIEILVPDTTCADAGLYKCVMSYSSNRVVFTDSNVQNVTSTVTSQMDILNVKTIEDGTPFKITCNAQRVIATQENFSTISILQILVLSNAAHVVSSNGAQDYKMVAQYMTLPLDGDTEASQDPPTGRMWQFSFNGSNSENRGVNNKATMKIEILVSDTTCADAGLYKCVMSYSSNRVVFTDSNVQNVTSTAQTTEPLIVLDPIYDAPTGVTNTSAYDLGATITVSCSFLGREELGMKWKREVRPAMGVDVRYEDYPIMNDITTDVATRQPGTSPACPEYAHKSVLKLTISEDDHERRYLCVVMSDNEETTTSGAAYIIVSGSVGLSSFDLTADPDLNVYAVGDNVTFTCKAMGSSAGVNFKWEFYVEYQFGKVLLQSLPYNATLLTKPPTHQPGSSHPRQYSWESTLSIQVPPYYRPQSYKCIVSYQQQQISGIGTISVMPRRCPTTPSNQAVAPRKTSTPSAVELVLLLLASGLLVEHSYVRVLPVSCLGCLIVATLCS